MNYTPQEIDPNTWINRRIKTPDNKVGMVCAEQIVDKGRFLIIGFEDGENDRIFINEKGHNSKEVSGYKIIAGGKWTRIGY